MTTSKRPELRALTGLRFFVAALVVFYHYGAVLAPYVPRAIANIMSNGYVGVSFFFLLSGYILAYNYTSENADGIALRGSRRSFWWNRFSRIYPLYALAWLLFLPFVLEKWLGSGVTTTGLAKVGVAGATTLGLVQTWIPGGTTWWNPPGWSIAVEAVFYAAFPFVLATLTQWGRSKPFRWLFLLWLLALTGPLIHNAIGGETLLSIVKFNPLLHLPEFAFGVVLAATRHDSRWVDFAARYRHRLVIVSVLVALGVLALPEGPPLYLLIHNGLLLPTFATCIAGLAEFKSPGPLGSRPLSVLGKASYGLYILQAPLQLGWRKTGWLSDRPVAHFIAYFVGLCAISIAAHEYFEQPLQRRLRGWYRVRTAAANAN